MDAVAIDSKDAKDLSTFVVPEGLRHSQGTVALLQRVLMCGGRRSVKERHPIKPVFDLFKRHVERLMRAATER